MSVGALVVVGPLESDVGPHLASRSRRFGGCPLACLEVLGRSALHRTIGFLLQASARPITVIAEPDVSQLVPRLAARFLGCPPNPQSEDCWSAAGRALADFVQEGVSVVLLVRLGAYVEINFADLLRFHLDCGATVTRAYDGLHPLDIWCLDGNSAAAAGLRQVLVAGSAGVKRYPVRGYVNQLERAEDIRALSVDGLLARCALRPGGREVRPGVWIEETAQVDRGARVVAPAYIGPHVRVRASSVITRCSNLEYASHVDYGTIVEDSSVLAYTYLGAGLDVTHAVVRGSSLADLRRNQQVEISDARLLSAAAPSGTSLRSLRHLLGGRGRWTARGTRRSV